jgi:hypothetical protein
MKEIVMKTKQQETPVLKYQNDKGFMLSFKRPTPPITFGGQ